MNRLVVVYNGPTHVINWRSVQEGSMLEGPQNGSSIRNDSALYKAAGYQTALRLIANLALSLLFLNAGAFGQATPSTASSVEPKQSGAALTTTVKAVVPKYIAPGKTVRGREITARVYGTDADG